MTRGEFSICRDYVRRAVFVLVISLLILAECVGGPPKSPPPPPRNPGGWLGYIVH